MKREIIGQGVAVVSIVAIVAAIVGAVAVYFLMPAPEEPAAPSTGFEDIHIILMAGGSESCPFTKVIVQGANDAVRLMGCQLDIMYSNWDPEQITEDTRTAVSVNPDGVIINPNPGYDALKPIVQDAEERGIIITTSGNYEKGFVDEYYTQGCGFVGIENNYQNGATLAKYVHEKYNIQPEDRVCDWSLWGYPLAAVQRDTGFSDYFESMGCIVDREMWDIAWTDDPEQSIPTIATYIELHPDIRVMAGLGFNQLSSAIPTILETAGKAPNDIIIACWDFALPVLDCISKGYMHVAIEQQQYLQGFIPVVQICLSAKYGFTGLTIDTGLGIIDDANYQDVWDLVEQGYR